MNLSSLSSWQRALISSWDSAWITVSSVLPNIIGSLLIISIGIVLATWVKRIVVLLIQKTELEKISEDIGVGQYLRKAGIDQNPLELVGIILQWFVLLIFIIASVNVLGLYGVSSAFNKLLSTIPTIISAVLILGLGVIVSRAIGYLIRLLFVSVDLNIARILGKVASTMLFLSFLVAAIGQFSVSIILSEAILEGLTYLLVLSFGLMIGLGGKDLVSKLLTDWYDRLTR